MDWWLIALIVYAVLNIIVLCMYAADKAKAMAGSWRISEKALLTAAAVGPFGAYAGMKLAHHKTQKDKFKLVKVFLGFHIIVIVGLLVILL